jgi:hypothetical protein
MPPAAISPEEAESVFRASESRPTLYLGRDQDPDGVAHSLARHYLITNAALMDRMEEARNGGLAYFSAFITRADMVAAALQVLNGAAGDWAREQLFDQAATPGRRRGSHTGMRAVIEHYGAWTCRARYAGGSGVMPVGSFRMLLDRADERPLKLHIHTFFPVLTLRPQVSRAEVKYQDGTLFARWP